MTTTQIRVRGYHEDRFGHVNHARYLEFLEDARWAHLEERGIDAAFLRSRGLFSCGRSTFDRLSASRGSRRHPHRDDPWAQHRSPQGRHRPGSPP